MYLGLKIAENSPEFSLLIAAKMKDGNYELNIFYNTQQKNETMLSIINEFCKSVIEYYNK